MALKKDQKTAVITEVSELLKTSKLTVIAKYKGLSVKQMQQLRASAKLNGTTVKVVKNRLVKQALKQVDTLKDVETTSLVEQLVYAFNSEDEVAPAQSLQAFARTNPQLEFVGAFGADGSYVSSDDVKMLANLPSKDQLRGQLVGTIAAPLTGFVRVLQGGQRGVLYALNARAESL